MTDLYREHDDVDHRFAFHPATSGEKRAEHDSFRGLCRELAHELVDRLPAGRERASALTNLEQVMFWGNAAIARAVPGAAHGPAEVAPWQPRPTRPTCRCIRGAGVPDHPGPPGTAHRAYRAVSDLPVDDDTLRDLAAS